MKVLIARNLGDAGLFYKIQPDGFDDPEQALEFRWGADVDPNVAAREMKLLLETWAAKPVDMDAAGEVLADEGKTL